MNLGLLNSCTGLYRSCGQLCCKSLGENRSSQGTLEPQKGKGVLLVKGGLQLKQVYVYPGSKAGAYT